MKTTLRFPAAGPIGAAALAATLHIGPAVAQPAAPASEDAPVLPAVRTGASAEDSAKESLRAGSTGLAKGRQELRDVPQSITVVTEKLIDDRQLETLKETLKNTGGVAFQAAEGGEEDIRLRGFSLQASGDIFIDGLRDPAFYERDSFNWDRVEVLRGSASMLFGRGSTGGAVNQVSKTPGLMTLHEIDLTLGSGGHARAVADLNWRTGDDAGLRVAAMATRAEPNSGLAVRRHGIAPALRWGIGQADEFELAAFVLRNHNGVHYGLPWLPAGASGGNGLWNTDPGNTYGMASDRADSGTTQARASHLHRLADRAELRTVLRAARYTRDQRASAIRFAPAALQPGGLAVNADRFADATVLLRSGGSGVQLKTMDMDTLLLQSDYSGRLQALGVAHGVQAGVDLAREDFENHGLAPDSPVLTKPGTTVGTPDDGARIDEGARRLRLTRRFEARAMGAYAQDLIEMTSAWKLLAGLRFDRLRGRYDNIAQPAAANNACAVQPARSLERVDSIWSRRVGLLFQPTPLASFHLSWGTSFNASGETYQFDAGTAQTPPESSRNVELGAKFDSERGDFSTRVALFRSTKYNERNRDAESVDACNYVLSGERHAAGFELDFAGRLAPGWEVYASYAYIPVARVDASSGAAGTEAVGSRPGLTPRHSGTVWTTWQLAPRWRVGAGVTARSGDKPVGLAPGSTVAAPGWASVDLMAEYTRGPFSLKANLGNVADRHYADFLYRGHYVPGKARELQLTLGYRFN